MQKKHKRFNKVLAEVASRLWQRGVSVAISSGEAPCIPCQDGLDDSSDGSDIEDTPPNSVPPVESVAVEQATALVERKLWLSHSKMRQELRRRYFIFASSESDEESDEDVGGEDDSDSVDSDEY